eukprot:5519341-Alexandrium_andersonii.AAC.1
MNRHCEDERVAVEDNSEAMQQRSEGVEADKAIDKMIDKGVEANKAIDKTIKGVEADKAIDKMIGPEAVADPKVLKVEDACSVSASMNCRHCEDSNEAGEGNSEAE